MPEFVEYDVETTSLQHRGERPGKVFLAQFLAPGDTEPTIIRASKHPHPEIQEWLNRPEHFRAWNCKFDQAYLREMGYQLPSDDRLHDGMVAAHIIDERSSVALQARGDALFGPEAAGKAYEDAVKAWLAEERKRRQKASKESGEEFVPPNYSDVPPEIMDPYAAHDPVLQRMVCDVYYPQIEADAKFKGVYELEMRVMRALFWAEDRGIPMDREALVNMEAEILPRLDTLEDRCVELSEFDGFNPLSPKQVGESLERLDADISKMERSGKSKQLKTDEENLQACDHPLAEAILAYRGERKTYAMLDGILHKGSGDDLFPSAYLTAEDRLHPNFRQLGARTGRMSCSNPNFQQVPRDDLRLRYAVRADEGHKLIACDLDSIELRLLAALAGEGALLDAIKRGDDPHAMTAKRVGLTGRRRSTGATESPRDQGKRLNFLIVYGGGLRAIRKWFGVDQARARIIYESMQRAYPEIVSLQARVDSRLLERGYLESPYTGRRWRMYGSGWVAVQKESYKFVNRLIQGLAAEILKEGIARCHEQGLPVIAAVHDELLAHAPAEDAVEVAHLMEQAMTENFELLSGQKLDEIVPITAEAQIVDRWSQCKKPDYVPSYAL